MEESCEVQCEENRAFPEEKKARKFKSREQLQGLEDYYNEHKYPTESMKAELAKKLNLTDKQVSGWFCHRRLKDKRMMESQAPGRQDLSSGVVQDRGSGLRQDSCSSTKQADYRLADVREVESRRFCRENLPAAELNYQQRRLSNVNEMNDTSSECNSAPEESLYPQNRSHLDFEATEYRAPKGFVPHARSHVGPSGYLKIKGHTENAAITAVKRQLGRHYREEGPSLGIEFDTLPPGAFESPSKIIDDDAYGVPEPYDSSPVDISGIHNRHIFGTIKSEDMYEAADYKQLHKSELDHLSHRQTKQKLAFPNHGHGFPNQKSPNGVDSYYARETLEYDNSRSANIQRKHNSPGMRSDSYLDHPRYPYGGVIGSEAEAALSPDHDHVNPKTIRRREQLAPRPAALSGRRKDRVYKEDRIPSSWIVKDAELYVDRRPMSEHHDSSRLKMLTNELRGGKRGREELFQEDYLMRTSSQEPPQWSKQIKGSTEMPSSFSEDETAETSSSME